MKALIVYYSQTGNTEGVSSHLSRCLLERGIDCRVMAVTPREKTGGLVSNVLKSFAGKAVPIEPCCFDPQEYDLIFVGSPVWAYQPAPAINAFLEEMPALCGQSVCPFVTMSKAGDKSTISRMTQKIEEKGGCVVDALALKTRSGVCEEHLSEIEAFVDSHFSCSEEPQQAQGGEEKQRVH